YLMSAYIFTIQDYHAIKEAKIRIEGITVLSGVNGSGKSTIARWFHRIVKILNNYENILIAKALEEYGQLIHSLNKIALISTSIRSAWSRITPSYFVPKRPESMPKYVMGLIDNITSLVEEKLTPEEWHNNHPRLCYTYGLEVIPEETIADFRKRLKDKIYLQSEDIQIRLNSYLKNRSMQHLNDVLAEEIDPSVDDFNMDISLKEDGVELLDKANFLQPLNLRESLYIETQRLVEPLNGILKSELGEYIKTIYAPTSKYSAAIATSVKKIIGGDVVLEGHGDGVYMDQDELHYVRKDGLNILLRGAATGIISFSHLLRLLENGWITNESVLIIDEPEAHLHPQWIVEYARVLVMINKHIGAKILISTHSPDMVAAIRSISERQKVLGTTLFYLATPFVHTNKYCYEDLGHEIGAIFDSFNIAAERIDQYGVTD
ncbi:MAG: ATP-binding protein, partial [Muribaculaceae bacterium]|nr:ATP-binding protein [Muribaculaceae bacterium]